MEKQLTMRGGQTPVQRYWCVPGPTALPVTPSCSVLLLAAQHAGTHSHQPVLVCSPACLPASPPLLYRHTLVPKVANGELKPSMVVTHVLPLEEAPRGFQIFNDKQDNCVKVVLRPQQGQQGRQPAGSAAYASTAAADMK